jgi:GNAT superfamily N-acetyltransferase
VTPDRKLPTHDAPARLRALLLSSLGGEVTPGLCEEIERAAWDQPEMAIDPAQFAPLGYGRFIVRVESFRAVLPELEELHRLHWLETEKHRHGLALAPDYDAMAARERAGRLLQFTVRAEGALVGHLRMYLAVSLHTQTIYAEEDTLFLLPQHRGGMLAIALMRYAETVLRIVGAREIRADSKLLNKADVLMKRLGYTPVALKFHKHFEG